MEIYLPKKSEYQGILYDTLTSGFRRKNVIAHLRKHLADIKELMGESYVSRIKKPADLERMISPIFYGYSLYEVDGVFFDEADKVVEERTQVIRLMFRFDESAVVEKIKGEVNEDQYRICHQVVDDYLNYPTVKPSFSEVFFDTYLKRWPKEKNLLLKVIHILELWEFNVAMFVLGFVIFKICEKIKLLHLKRSKKPEDEIWITSFWNLRVNRICRTDQQ
jgi:hypothetical protein